MLGGNNAGQVGDTSTAFVYDGSSLMMIGSFYVRKMEYYGKLLKNKVYLMITSPRLTSNLMLFPPRALVFFLRG